MCMLHRKGTTLFEKFKQSKITKKLGAGIGKFQLKAPVHPINSMIIYAIGVIAGMQDMAQVSVFSLLSFTQMQMWQALCTASCCPLSAVPPGTQ